MRKKIMLSILALLAAGAVTGASAQQKMTLEEYIAAVEANNAEIKAADLAIESISNKILELDMAYSPYLSGGYSYTDDRSGDSFGSTLPTDRIQGGGWNLTAAKKFTSGGTLSAGYTSSDATLSLSEPTEVFGPDLGKISSFTGYEMKPYVKYEQSLLRELGGGLTKAGIMKSKAAARAGQYAQLFKKQQALLKARATYWSLSLSRDVISFRNASLERTRKMLEWTGNRVQLDLAEKSDLLQMQAAVKMRELNLQMASEDETKTCREFNNLLGRTSDTVDVELEKISDKVSDYGQMACLKAAGVRADVLAARANYESSQYADRETQYRARPELSVNGSYSLHGLALSRGDAWSQVRDGDKPAYAIGLTFIVPLDYKTLNKVKHGYKQDFQSAKQSLDKAELSAKNDWEQLCTGWTNVKSRLSLAGEIKAVQEQRLENEQKLFQRGRTTTYQMLTAENDLDDATLNVYRLIYEELMLGAQAELYATQPLP